MANFLRIVAIVLIELTELQERRRRITEHSQTLRARVIEIQEKRIRGIGSNGTVDAVKCRHAGCAVTSIHR